MSTVKTTFTKTKTKNSRIPLNVNHYENSSGVFENSIEEKIKRTNSNKLFEQSDFDQIYNMQNIHTETDRIKNSMREFEARCNKWREEFFSKKSNEPSVSQLHCQTFFDQQVPSRHSGNSDFIKNKMKTSSYDGSSSPFLSSMHRSEIEDLNDGSGGKKYKIEFEIGDFKENELFLSTHDNVLIIKGDRELKAGSATETKTFNRELTLPDYVDTNKMSAFLKENPNEILDTNLLSTSSQTRLEPKLLVNNLLIIEAPIVMEKYCYRRSVFDNSQSPIRIQKTVQTSPDKNHQQDKFNSKENIQTDTPLTTSEKSTTSTTKTIHSSKSHNIYAENKSLSNDNHTKISKHEVNSNNNKFTFDVPVRYDINQNYILDDNNNNNPAISSLRKTNVNDNKSNQNINKTLNPELLFGYPVYDNIEGCVIYKFNLTGFDQSEIHLTITVDRNLEIKACKEQVDHLGKIYHEFKREIALEPEVDANLIKNILHEGILTLKIPKANRPDGNGSLSNNHNLQAPDSFKEFYTDDGKLSKLTADFRGFNPENVKIVLSANNLLKVTAQQSELSQNKQGKVQKECTRHYTLPRWVQAENMKAIMSREGILTIDFILSNGKN